MALETTIDTIDPLSFQNRQARPRANRCRQAMLGLKNIGGTILLSAGKLGQHAGQLLFSNSIGNRYFNLPEIINRYSPYAFLFSGTVITGSTRFKSIYDKLKDKCNCEYGDTEFDERSDELEQGLNHFQQGQRDNSEQDRSRSPSPSELVKQYTPETKKEAIIYYTITACGGISGCFATINSLLSAMLLYGNFQHDKSVVHPEDITPSAGLFASAIYVGLCTASSFYAFKLDKVKLHALQQAKTLNWQNFKDFIKNLDIKTFLTYSIVICYTLGYGIFSKTSTEHAFAAIAKVLGHPISKDTNWINGISWFSALPALSTTFFSAGRNLIHIVNGSNQPSHKPIRLKPQNWSSYTTPLFLFMAVSGVIDTYANTVGFMGSSHDSLPEIFPNLRYTDNHNTLMAISWFMAITSILPYWALNGAESLDAIFGYKELLKEVDVDKISLQAHAYDEYNNDRSPNSIDDTDTTNFRQLNQKTPRSKQNWSQNFFPEADDDTFHSNHTRYYNPYIELASQHYNELPDETYESKRPMMP